MPLASAFCTSSKACCRNVTVRKTHNSHIRLTRVASYGIEAISSLSHTQSACDKQPGIAVIRSQLEAGLADVCHEASFLAAILDLTVVTGD